MNSDVWGDEGDIGDGYYAPERVDEIGNEAFRVGAQMCREMMARFVEQGGDVATAMSIRANWNPAWGGDPGKPTDKDYDMAMAAWDWAAHV